MLKITRQMLEQTAVRAAALGLTLQSSEDSVEKLAREGFDPAYGARPLRRAIRSRVEDAIAYQVRGVALRYAHSLRSHTPLREKYFFRKRGFRKK